MPQFFIDRPVFAWVIAIIITLGGVFAIRALPAEAYPDVAPPQVSISATYPGANADVVERTVIQVIEQQLTGIDNLMYFSSSSSNGGGSITLFFESGTNPDTAAVQTQNRVTLAEPRLPREVVLQGLQVAKVNSGFLMAVSLRSKDNSVPSDVLNNIVAAQVLDPISRIPGVGQTPAVRRRILDAHLAEPGQAAQLPHERRGRARQGPRPERAVRHRRAG